MIRAITTSEPTAMKKRKWLCEVCGGAMRVIKSKMIGVRTRKRKRRLECSTCGDRITTDEQKRVHQ